MEVSLSLAMKTAVEYADSISNRELGYDYYHDSFDWFNANVKGTPTEYGDWIELVHIFTINRNQLALADCYLATQHLQQAKENDST